MILTTNTDLLQITNSNTHRTLDIISINKSLQLSGPISIRPYRKHTKDESHFNHYSYGIFEGMTDEEIDRVQVLSLGYSEDLIFRDRDSAFSALEDIDGCLN